MEKDGKEMRNDKIRVAVVAGGLTVGGVESVIYNYVSHMNREDYEWFYISYDTPDRETKDRFEELGFHVFAVAKKKEHFFRSCREVYDILKKNHIGIVHSHMTLMCFITNILGYAAGAKVLISHSHLAPHVQGIKKYVYDCFKVLSRWTATDYFACGEEAGIYLFGKKNMSNGNVTVLNNALDYQKFSFSAILRSEIRREWRAENKVVIGHVGRFTEQKNHTFLIEIFAEYKRRNPDSLLVLAGDGPLLPKIQAYVQKLGIEKDVLFTGAIGDTARCYMGMDVFLFPSLYEGLSVAALEAQTSGLPIVASDRVAKETALTKEGMLFLPLEAGAEKWADAIEACQKKRISQGIFENLKKRNLDIDSEAEKLDMHYHRMMERKK